MKFLASPLVIDPVEICAKYLRKALMENGEQKLTPAGIEKELPADWQKIRSRLLEDFSSRVEGLDVTRISNFTAEHQLAGRETIFIYDEDVPEIRDLFGTSNLLRGTFDNNERGTFIAELNLSLVRRDKKYLYKTPKGLTHVSSSIAAFGLEMLCQRNDEIYQTLFDVRDDVESLRSLAQQINSHGLGMYEELQRLQYTETDFLRGLQKIIDTLYNGKVPLNDRGELS